MNSAMKILYMESFPEVLRLGAQHLKHKRSRLGGSQTFWLLWVMSDKEELSWAAHEA